MKAPPQIERYLRALTEVFRRHRDKREAHAQSHRILREISHDPLFVRGALSAYLDTPGALSRGNYPVVALPIANTSEFELVVNCWIPRPDQRSDMATKPIHHHGSLLLSTVTLFGPGYEHWTFARPESLDPAEERYRLRLLATAPHPKHHTDFVDSLVAHVPLYPASLSLTLALWSSSQPTGLLDLVKRNPLVQRYRVPLKALAQRLQLTQALSLNVVEYFDFLPKPTGFVGMKERVEYALGPSQDHRESVFAILQQTGNEGLLFEARRAAARDGVLPECAPLLSALGKGLPLSGRLSDSHLRYPYADFSRADIARALAAQERS
jgi:hypothetical protein